MVGGREALTFKAPYSFSFSTAMAIQTFVKLFLQLTVSEFKVRKFTVLTWAHQECRVSWGSELIMNNLFYLSA